MPINHDVVGARGEPRRASWDKDRCLLYAVGVGAGAEDPVGSELEFTTENTAGIDQKVLPTFVVVSGFTAKGGKSAMSALGSYDTRMMVHGEQGIVIHKEIPVEGEIETVDEITGLYDKGKGAVVAARTVANLVGESEPLFETTSSIFINGEGGWGGDRGPSEKANVAPDRDPDVSITYQTREDQALLYRLSGDKNPLHSDKQFSDVGGFPKPILHGLCTYGFTGRALLHGMCDGDTSRFEGMEGRFSSPVMPGEALTVNMWADGDGHAIFQTRGGDGRIVINNGGLTFSG